MSQRRESVLVHIATSYADRLGADGAREVIELAKAGEWGVALENLCEDLYDASCPLKPDDYSQIASLAEGMGLDARRWAFVSALVEDGSECSEPR